MSPTTFDDARACTYRKTRLVLAFRTGSPVRFSKSWGEQHIRAGGWVIVPLTNGTPTEDLYGIDDERFRETYEPVGPTNTYRKRATVRAYQPGKAFEVVTRIDDHVETERAVGSATSWMVRNPTGEVYPVSDETFRESYEPVDR